MNVDVELPAYLRSKLTDSASHQSLLAEHVGATRTAMRAGDVAALEREFLVLEHNLDDFEAYLDQAETEVHAQLKNCHIAVDADPHLSQVAPEPPSSRGGKPGRTGTAGQGAHKGTQPAQGRGIGGVAAGLLGAVFVGLVVVGLWTASQRLNERAKKIK